MDKIVNKVLIRPEREIKKSKIYDDTLTSGAALESNAVTIEDDLNAIRSQLKKITGEAHWYSEPATDLNGVVAGGISENSHKNLDTLTHNISENSYVQLVRTSGKVTSIVIWDSSAMTLKIREFIITRTSGKVASVVAKQYDNSGNIVETLTQVISRDSSGKTSSITNTET